MSQNTCISSKFLIHQMLKVTIWHLQAANIEADASGIHDGEYQLTKHEFSSLGHGKYSGTGYNLHIKSLVFIFADCT